MQDAAAEAPGASTRPRRRNKARASDREGMPRGACDAEDDEDAWLRDDDEATTRPGPSCDVSRDDGASAAVHPAPALLHRPGLDVTGERRRRRMRCAEEPPALAASSSSSSAERGAGHEVGGVAAAGRRAMPSGLMKPLVVLAFPGMYLVYKITEFKRQQQEHNRRKVTERELAHLNHKIDKLLTKLEEHEPELATSQEEECVVCVSAKASMQTFPCGHRVVCRKCFVKTIQVAVSQRVLPLRCVICRTKIVRLKHSSHGHATPVTPGTRALLAPCEALGGARAGPFLRPQDLHRPLEPLPTSHYRHSAEACRFHRHRAGGTDSAGNTPSPEPSTSLPATPETISPTSCSSTSLEREDSPADVVVRGRRSGLTRAVVHQPPRSPPSPPPPKAICPPPPPPARSPRSTNSPKNSGPSCATPAKRSTTPDPPPAPKTPPKTPPKSTSSPSGSPKGRSTPSPAKTDRCLPPKLQPPPTVRPLATAPKGCSLSPAALSTVVLAPPPSEVRSRRGGQHRVSPGVLPLTVRPPPPKPRPPSRFEKFRDLHVRRPSLLLPIPEKEEPEGAVLEAAFCRVAPGSSDLLVSASSPKIVLQDRAPLLQPDSPDRRRSSLRSQLRSKMAGFPSLLGSPLRALRGGARHRRVPDIN